VQCTRTYPSFSRRTSLAWSYRIEPLVHLGRHIAVGPQFADAYTYDLQLRHRSLGGTLLFSF
jgi:hypothetical protein